MTQKSRGAEIHPLMEKEISFILRWKEWKELWKATKQADLLHSLLHCGFSVRVDGPEEIIERVLLYLEIADKHRDGSWEFEKNKREEHERFYEVYVAGKQINSFADLRLLLAQKAFRSLCQDFFKNTREEHDIPSWVPIATHPQVLEKLFWFFRLNENGNILNLRNPNDHLGVVAAEFIRNLCEFAWTCENSNRWSRGEIDEETKEILRKARPNMITPLFGLGELNNLFKSGYELDEECMKRLEELALGFDLWLPKTTSWGQEHRKPKNIEEACLGNSRAARALLVLQTIQTAKKHLDNIRKLEMQRIEAEEELQKIQK